jgi:adenosylcobinamide-GDP ribazoletransferase
LRIAALAALPIWQGVIVLLIAHTTARAAMVIAITLTEYARDNGLGDSVKNGTDTNQLYTALGIAVAIAFILAVASGHYLIIFAPIVSIGVAWAVMQYVKSRIGGYTGDSLGAMEQITEITIMIALVGMLS